MKSLHLCYYTCVTIFLPLHALLYIYIQSYKLLPKYI
jgi:hypothetical protein